MGDFDVDRRFAEIAHLVAEWEFAAARERVQDLLDRADLTAERALNARLVLAEILRELGDLTAAYDLAEVVTDACQRLHGPGHPRTIRALALLATVHHDFEELDDAEALYRRVLDRAKEHEDDSEAARAARLAQANLALLYRDRGERALARDLLNAAYLVHRREYGAEDLDTVRIAAELAAVLRDDGDTAAARRLFTIAHAAARSRLGDRHPATRAMEWELAAVDTAVADESAFAASQPVGGVRAALGSRPDDGSPPHGVLEPLDVLEPLHLPEPIDRPKPLDVPEPLDPPEPFDVVHPDGETVVPGAADADTPSHAAAPRRPVGLTLRAAPLRRIPARVLVALASVVLLAIAVALAWPDRPAGRAGPSGAAATGPAATPVTATTTPAPAVGQAAPTEPLRVRLRDEGTALAVSWTGAGASVVVALSRAGAPAVVLASLPPEATEYVVRGVEPGVEYCVVVGPLTENEAVSRATSVCTGRRSG